ncbi:ricin-type beta-trefoil lectin domain protein [Streptomyces echinoruber]|uniref:Ricin B lectin domain-containing protein n=1 Tax=Streptomyces echinoruber TaxID=68898 RepID=A0A918RJG8_9ACTN|nr:RICIN domain-containing protein [Streptomyces echinoruber]GGZ98773.1 hypothetical protein GCM10010389_42460 [Streptomyces echinoruber]
MAHAEGSDNGVGTGRGSGMHAEAPDVRLIELLRARTPTVYPALRELRLRHRSAVLALARTCATSEATARQLAAQVFTMAARRAARGTEPRVPVRLDLLLLTVRLAAAWAKDPRTAGGLDPALLLVLNAAGPAGPVPPLLAAFESLPTRDQGLIWYGVVDREPEERTATFLGLTRADVLFGTEPALQALAQACLRIRLAASDDPRCGDFRRLIEEAVRPDAPRHSTDLHAHMAHCPHCTAAHAELSALRDDPRTTLAEGLLPWGGASYTRQTTAAAPEPPGQVARAAVRLGRAARRGAGGTRAWPPPRRYVIASTAVGVVVPLVLCLLLTGGSRDQRAAAPAAPAPGTPSVTVTETLPPPTSRPPSPSPTSASPSPTRTSAPPRRTARPRPTPTPTPSPVRPPGGTSAQVVNVATGRCLDVAGDFDNGTDVRTAPCSSSPTQRWRVDSVRGVLVSSADPDFCLDSRGDVDKGVGIWQCSSLNGDHAVNLQFVVDDDGVVRPAIAIETALTPDEDGDGLSLEPLTGGAGQRWRAGRA